ncbi:MAG TPA: tetratricopeptide repeat protein [Verrucomicrobiae bacterium]|nr:tetratricopeptide repeat protein [Verrucomicrobiae bacterium]
MSGRIMNQDENPAGMMRLVQVQTSPTRASTPNKTTKWSTATRLIACVALGVATLTTFWPVLHANFINFDDGEYVLQNPHVATGLTPRNIVWAFTASYASNWHPLTWISHMLDVQMFGLDPTAHHAVNLLLHIANTTILFLLLLRLTEAPWPSLAVAGLFALHPLHVESVAWVAERKDLLSTLFFLLTIWAYAMYVEATEGARPPEPGGIGEDVAATQSLRSAGTRPYRFALVFFALGLMSKPMLVTLPFVLLLLDYWPLCRIKPEPTGSSARLLLLKEKIPFLLLAVVSCLVTFFVQSRAHSVKLFLPMTLRLENAVVSYVAYLSKTVWPARLCVFYPHPDTRYGLSHLDPAHPASEQWPAWTILVAAAGLLAVSFLAFRWRKSRPWVFTGWFWYLGTLVPVIGVVQVGMQRMADRYTYIPLIGIFLSLAWSGDFYAQNLRQARLVSSSLAAAVLLACGLAAHTQAGYWHDDEVLFEHALTVTTNNAVAESHVGAALANRGRLDLAEQKFKIALADDPFFYFAHSALGSLYEAEGHPEQSMQEYRRTLELRPWDEFAHLHLAGVLHKLGRDEDAIAEYKKNVQANPDSVEGNYQLGAMLLDRGELADANYYLSKAVELKPDHVDALLCLADLRTRQGKLPGAEAALEALVKIYPTNAELRINLASLLWQGGQRTEALKQYARAVYLRPGEPIGHFDLAIAHAGSGEYQQATKELEEAIRLKPDYPEALSELAWLLATNPHPDKRNGKRALELARRSLELAGAADQVRTWAALDVACAENGQFRDATTAAQKAKDLATRQGKTDLAQAAEERLLLYQAGRPYHLP